MRLAVDTGALLATLDGTSDALVKLAERGAQLVMTPVNMAEAYYVYPLSTPAGRGGLSASAHRSRRRGAGRVGGALPPPLRARAFGRGAPAPAQTARRPTRACPSARREHISMIMNYVFL